MEREYTGRPENRTAEPWASDPDDPDPRRYLSDARLVDAVNVALVLRRPLLLAGEPGTGKTELAWSLAWELNLDKPLTFETKSTSVARDLFYSYDAVGHFRRVPPGREEKEDPRVLDFIEWNALGEAIIRSKSREDVHRIFAGKEFPEFRDGYQRRHVVLIDEVDKAPRDFPNDLLNEFERKFFRVPEWRRDRITAHPANLPIIVLTSNSEKNLPDAFLRRCAFHHISFPGEETLARIVETRLPVFGQRRETGLVREAIEFFLALRDQTAPRLEKRPATAELIDWLMMLRHSGINPEASLASQQPIVLQSIAALAKSEKDQRNIREWIESQRWEEMVKIWKAKS